MEVSTLQRDGDIAPLPLSTNASLLARLEDAAPALLERLVRSLPDPEAMGNPEAAATQEPAIEAVEAEALYADGYDLFEQEEWRDALTVFVHLVARKPSESRFQFAAGMCFQQLGNALGAALAFSQALMLEPERADIAFRLGESMDQAGMSTQAEPMLENALVLINADFARYHHLQAPAQARLASVRLKMKGA